MDLKGGNWASSRNLAQLGFQTLACRWRGSCSIERTMDLYCLAMPGSGRGPPGSVKLLLCRFAEHFLPASVTATGLELYKYDGLPY